MDITKYKHACLMLEKNGQKLIIDPGCWNEDVGTPEGVVGIIVTHDHADHFDKGRLAAIIAVNPDAKVYAQESLTREILELPTRPVAPSESLQIGDFVVRFTGGTHAVIHHDVPAVDNIGVVVDEGELYYPGDSFTLPDCVVTTLALPISAPWMKVAEAMDFLVNVSPRTVMATHDLLLSREGHAVTDNWIQRAADSCGAYYQRD